MKGIHLSEFARMLGVSLESSAPITGYQIDSRRIQPGEIFFALPGERVDGHSFLHEARERGALAAVVLKKTMEEGLTLLAVDDVKASLQEAGRQSILLKPTPMIGVTGSVGKTTTKEFVATLLEGRFRVGKSAASCNSKLTYPLNFLNRSGQEDSLVFEMGMSALGEIERLVQIAAPDVAILTKVSLAHAMNFPEGLSGIARAKAEIFSDPKTKAAVIDIDFLEYREIVAGIRAEKMTFSIQNSSADYYLSAGMSRCSIDERGVRAIELELPFKATHLLQNFIAAVAAVRYMGIQWDEIERQIPFLKLPKMRFEEFERGGIHFVNDAYNASPASMRAALENLPEPREGGKRIAVLATMKELGLFSIEAHEEIGRFASKRVDVLLCLGEEAGPLARSFEAEAKKQTELFTDHQCLAEKLREIMRPGDVVLLKGSRSMQVEKILGYLDYATSDC